MANYNELRISIEWTGGVSDSITYAILPIQFIVDGKLFATLPRVFRANMAYSPNNPGDDVRDMIGHLSLQQEPVFPKGRFQISGCIMCGDIGCGALTAHIVEDHKFFIWKSFGNLRNLGEDLEEGQELWDDEDNVLWDEDFELHFRKDMYLSELTQVEDFVNGGFRKFLPDLND